MLGRTGDRHWRSLRLIGIALYAAVLIIAPFEHHDLSCELKTPQHCLSCASSQLGSDPPASVVPAVWRLSDAGLAVPTAIVSHDVILVVHIPGRSPPAQS